MNSHSIPPSHASDDLIPAGTLQDGPIAYAFAIYYLPMPWADPFESLDGLLAGKFNEFRLADAINGDETEPTVNAWVTVDPSNDCPPPDPEFVRLFSLGLSPQQAAALQTTHAAMILNFVYPNEQAWGRMRAALQLTGDLAAATGGLIWDNATRQMFTPAAWNELRVDRWTDTIPDINDHTILHAYETGGQMRLVTLGMGKVGLPDVVVNQVPRSACSDVGLLVNVFCQAIAERPAIERPGEFDLDHARIRPHASGAAQLTVKIGAHDDGDPENRLLEITFDRGPGRDVHARRHAILAAAFNSTTGIVPTTQTNALEAASLRATAKLPALRTLFNEGLPPGEYLQVKAPFDGPDGTQEWIWVDVVRWNGNEITGSLANKPFNIPTLDAGQTVVVEQSAIFDYVHKRSDGTIEGNETEKLISSALN